LINVFLAGEGPNELGGWSTERGYRDDRPAPGVLESLARQLVPAGWEVRDAIRWKDIRKLGLGTKGKGAERKAVLAAHLHASERGCAALLFSRDRDGNTEREREIEAALAEIHDDRIDIAGGVCVERLESWLVALAGRTGSERLRDGRVNEALTELGVPAKDTAGMLGLIERHGLAAVPPDASSLHTWIERVRAALGAEPTA
jgi:hypothetical protein